MNDFIFYFTSILGTCWSQRKPVMSEGKEKRKKNDDSEGSSKRLRSIDEPSPKKRRESNLSDPSPTTEIQV